MSEQAEGYPEIYDDLAALVTALLREHGLGERAVELGRAAAVRVNEKWGGELVYFPKGQSYIVSQRDLELCKRLRGDNLAALCREYGITLQRGYQILAAWRARETERRQIPLLDNN